ncbi:MAG: hypothetical protein K2Q20_00055, partial [Phycisphaerales bacterium]|nr:hypothetical protein [Phycisphaerales bacterium]
MTEFFDLDLNSLRLTTQGNVNIIDNDNFSNCWDKPEGWLVRDPQSSGVHVLRVLRFLWANIWIGGGGHFQLEAWRPTLRSTSSQTPPSPLIKMGPGTMVYNPPYNSGRWPASDSAMIVRDGTLALAGPGVPYMFTDQVQELLKIGGQYGGQDYPPGTVPPASWSPFPIPVVPPVKSPRVVIQADNVIPPGKVVRMGSNSVLRFEAPEPISFLGTVVSDTPGATTRIECAPEPTEAVAFDASSLGQFLGTFRIERGVARLQGAPNAAASFSLAAPTFPYEAVLELKVPGAQYGFASEVSGLGRVVKWGAQALLFSSDTSGFTGDFVIEEGHLVLMPGAAGPLLRNAVTVDGPTSVLNQQASNAVADNTVVSLDDSGKWLLNGRSDTISRLKLFNNARLELGGGTLTLGGGVLTVFHTPGGATTATVAGPGTLASAVPLAVDSSDSLAPIGLDIQATLAAPSVLFAGLGTVRLAGSGAAGPSITVQSGAVRLARTGVNAATGAVTIGDPGHGLPWTPDAAVVLGASDQLPDNKAVTMNVRGSFDLNGFTDTIGGLVVSGDGPFGVGAGTG